MPEGAGGDPEAGRGDRTPDDHPPREVVPRPRPLAGPGAPPHSPRMFIVPGAGGSAIRAAFERDGEWPPARKIRRLFPGITDPRVGRACAWSIAGWRPWPLDGKEGSEASRRKPGPGGQPSPTNRRGGGGSSRR